LQQLRVSCVKMVQFNIFVTCIQRDGNNSIQTSFLLLQFFVFVRLTRHRSALPANPNSSRPRSWALGDATLVVAERSGWRRVFGVSKPRPSAKGAHPYRKRACLEALRLATTKLTNRGTGYPSWGHTTQLRISRGSTGLIHKWRILFWYSEFIAKGKRAMKLLKYEHPTTTIQTFIFAAGGRVRSLLLAWPYHLTWRHEETNRPLHGNTRQSEN